MPPKVEIVRAWIERAVEDLRAARLLIEGDTPLARAGCFHCQQAAEKTLKAYLQWREVSSPKIHDLDKLVALCVAEETAFDVLHAGDWLNEFAVDVRYPGGPEPDIARAREALVTAERLHAFVLDRLPKEARV